MNGSVDESESPDEGEWLQRTLSTWSEVALMRLSADGRVIGWFGASERLFGYTADEVRGRPFEFLFTAADRERGLPRLELEVAAGVGRAEDDRWHLRKDGSRFWASGALTPQRDDRGRLLGFAKQLRDRTDLHMRFEALTRRVEALSSSLAQRQTDHLTLLHELRNSLSAMLQASVLLERQVPAGTPSRRLVEVALRQAQVMKRLLDDSAQTACATAAAPPPERTLVSLQEALRIAADSVDAECRERRLQLRVYLPEAPVSVPADPEQLQRMLLNLLSNAVKYTPPGGHVDLSLTVEGDQAAIRIDDDGVGIAAENLERIFHIFTREPNADPDAPDGFGIGLAVVERLAALHGGFVEARSAGKGKGSQFTLRLPMPEAAARSAPVAPPQADRAPG